MRWWQAVVHAGGVLLMDCIGYSRLISDLVRAAGWFLGVRAVGWCRGIGLVLGFLVDGGVDGWSVLGGAVGLNRVSPAGSRFRPGACHIRVVRGGDIRRKSLEFRGFVCSVDGV